MALILALCVLVFFVTGSLLPVVEVMLEDRVGYDPTDLEIGKLWADLVTVLIGGLVAYIAGGPKDDT